MARRSARGRTSASRLLTLAFSLTLSAVFDSAVLAQRAPEIGYIFPPVVRPGVENPLTIGAYDWTPDVDVFVFAGGAQLKLTGDLGPLMMPEPPYLTGTKAYGPRPLPREISATLLLHDSIADGAVQCQVANANGTSEAATVIVSRGVEVLEDEPQIGVQALDALPVAISGRIARNEEVDRYRFRAVVTGPVTCDLWAFRLGSRFNGVITVTDDEGNRVSDAVDTTDQDCQLTFAAEAGREYTVAIHEFEFRGHRSYVYRLVLNPSPRVLAALPAAGRRGETREVEFIYDDGKAVRRVSRTVSFPSESGVESFLCTVDIGGGVLARHDLLVRDVPETVGLGSEGNDPLALEVPVGVTQVHGRKVGSDRYAFVAKKDERWRVEALAQRIGSPLDLVVVIVDNAGKEVARADDSHGTMDPEIEFVAPADGRYEIRVEDISGPSSTALAPPGRAASIYRLGVTRPVADFALSVAQRVNVVIGAKAEIAVSAVRSGGFVGPIAVTLHGLPPGITVPAETVIPSGESELKVPLTAADDAPSGAAVVSILGSARLGDVIAVRSARSTARSGRKLDSILVATTMKPRLRIWPIESDERTVHQGSTHLAPVGIARLEGFEGDVLVQMVSKQPSKFRRGFLGPDIRVPPEATSVLYPCFMPEGLETVDAYRMTLGGVVQVKDPKGRLRFLLSTFRNTVSIGITIEGALLKLAREGDGADKAVVASDGRVTIPVRIFRSPKVRSGVTLELEPGTCPGSCAFTADALDVPVDAEHVDFPVAVKSTGDECDHAEHDIILRATALAPARGIPEITDAMKSSPMAPGTLDQLRSGLVPTVARMLVPVKR